jgi:nitrite reductase/ring-hydroxylating ferredoxin subunit
MADSELIGLCSMEEVPEGTALKVEHDNLVLAVFNLGGRFFVTDDACTHGPGSLSEGDIDGEIVECNFHQGAFHIPTGRVEAPPCMIPLKNLRRADRGREGLHRRRPPRPSRASGAARELLQLRDEVRQLLHLVEIAVRRRARGTRP